MKNVLKISIALFVTVALGACGSSETKRAADGKTGGGESGDKKVISVEPNMDAETLAQAGEQLMNPATFMLADTALDMSLAKDPENKRAQFYKYAIKRLMTLKGAGTRFRPFIAANGDVKTYDVESKKFPNSPLKDFLFKGKEDIKTMTQVQDFLVSYRDALLEYHTWLRKNQDLNLTLNLNPFVFQGNLRADELNACEVVGTSENGLDVKCDYTEIAQRKVNAADMIAIRQMVAGEILYFTIYTAYSAEGVDRVVRLNKKRNLTGEQILDILTNNAEFGKLRKDNTLSIITSLGADLMSAWKWALANQRALCPAGELAGTRKGQVFENGICIKYDSETEKYANLADQALMGAITVKLHKPGTDNEKETRVDYLAWARKPVADLRDIAPVSFNHCDKADRIKDNTLGGFYPNGDAEFFLDTKCDD
ncbi:MAG: hypothetical protein ABL958_10380 [Bdellovibrionia bacterium]